MITASRLRSVFSRHACGSIIYRKVARSSGRLTARPSLTYENVKVKDCIIVTPRRQFSRELTGSTDTVEFAVIRNPKTDEDEIKVSAGDRVVLRGELTAAGEVSGGEEFTILKHTMSERIQGFKIQRLDLKRVEV